MSDLIEDCPLMSNETSAFPLVRLKRGRLEIVRLQFESICPVEGMSVEDIKRPVEGIPLVRLKCGKLEIFRLQFESVSPVEGMSVEDINIPVAGRRPAV